MQTIDDTTYTPYSADEPEAPPRPGRDAPVVQFSRHVHETHNVY